MNTIEIAAEDVPLPTHESTIRDFCNAVLLHLGKENHELSLLLCNNERIRQFNAEYRGKDEATDVLSFGQEVDGAVFPPPAASEQLESETRSTILGDIVLALPYIAAQAHEFGVSFESEFKRMLVHGILHLSGVHHDDEVSEHRMNHMQETILSELEQEYRF